MLGRKKIIALLLAVFMIGLLAASCARDTRTDTPKQTTTPRQTAGPAPTEQQRETVSMLYVVPGTPPTDLAVVLEEVNKKLEEDGRFLKIDVEHIAWDVWDSKTNLMLSTGEAFDLMHVMHDRMAPGIFVGRGALTPLDEYIAKYPGLIAAFEQIHWDSIKVEGKIYAIPAYWRDFTTHGGMHGQIGVRLDMLEANGLEIPETVEQLIAVGEVLQQNWGGDETVYMWEHDIRRPPTWIHRTYDNWPLHVDFNSIFRVDMDGNVTAYIESEEFKNDAMIFRQLYQKGLIHPDILSLPRDQQTRPRQQGNFIFGLGTTGIESYPGLKVIIPDVKMTQFQLSPGKKNLVFSLIGNSNVVPSTSKNPEIAVNFLDWLYTSKENHDLFLYGIEGTHYNAIGENRREVIMDENNRPIYQFDYWQVGLANFCRFHKDEMEEYIEISTNSNPNVYISPILGFSFNIEPVATEFSNVMAEMVSSIFPIKLGVVDYDTYFPDALRKLQAAGLDRVIAEYQKQLSAFMESK